MHDEGAIDGHDRRGQVVQIAPNDHPPFGDITRTYTLAVESLGLESRTIFLSPPRGTAMSGVQYLNLEDLAKVRSGGRALARALHGVSPVLAVCHRYRAYRMFQSSGVRAPRFVTVAHEFGFFRRFRRRLSSKLLGRNVLYAGVSPAVEAELADVVPDPLCLPNAIDIEAFEAARLERTEALAALGVPASEEFTVGIVGRLVEKKQPELAIGAVEELIRRGVSVRLLVIGDGPLREALETRARDLPVTFCGFVSNARRLLSAMDVLLITSLEVEAFGMVALEAMVSSVPVVSGTAPGPQFVLGSTGYYYTRRAQADVADALMQAREDLATGELAGRLDHAHARAVREFSVAALARRLDDLFFRMR
jgi:glycosyltransferase involved in cell wall biosynthesis